MTQTPSLRTFEARQTRLTEPAVWWQVDRVVTRGTRLYYGLASPRSVRDPGGGFRRDGRGRVALEAFGGLPIDRMYRRLDERRVGVPPVAEGADREPFEDLIAFVEVFGPLGLEWPRAWAVENPEVDRLARQNEGLRMASRGLFGPTDAPDPAADAWRVILPKSGTLGSARVEPAVSHAGLAWEEAIRAGDDLLPHDELGPSSGGPLTWAHERLMGALDLADAIARTDKAAIGRHLDARVLNIPDVWRWDAPRGRARVDRDVGSAKPLRRDVDWLERGRQALALHLSAELFHSGVGVDARGDTFRLAPRLGSLLEVIHLQLVEHLQRHPDFGIGRCGFCEMPILRVRRNQRFHAGCGPAARQRESRARRKRTHLSVGS